MLFDIFLGNIFSLFSALCVAISMLKKRKNNLMHWQAFNSFFGVIADIVLMANTAVIIDTLCLVRNTLSYKKLLNKTFVVLFMIASISLGLYVNNLGWIGYLPILASTEYTLCIYITKNAQQMRYAAVVNMVLWLIHGICIRAYAGSVVSVFLIIWTIVQIIRNQKFRLFSYVKGLCKC